MCQQCDKFGICFKTKLDFRVTRDNRVFTMDATALVESALIRLAMLEKETAMLKADLGLALEAMKTLNIKEDVKVEAGGKFPVPVSRTNTETTESSLPSSSSSKDAAAKADYMEFTPCSPAAKNVVKNAFGDPQVGTYISPVKKDAEGNPLSRPVYEGPKHGRYYLTESGNKAYATPTSGGLFHVGIKVEPASIE